MKWSAGTRRYYAELQRTYKNSDGITLDKMAAISQTIYSDAFPNETFCILIKISQKFVPEGSSNKNSALG